LEREGIIEPKGSSIARISSIGILRRLNHQKLEGFARYRLALRSQNRLKVRSSSVNLVSLFSNRRLGQLLELFDKNRRV
jgi:hypothetical protein